MVMELQSGSQLTHRNTARWSQCRLVETLRFLLAFAIEGIGTSEDRFLRPPTVDGHETLQLQQEDASAASLGSFGPDDTSENEDDDDGLVVNEAFVVTGAMGDNPNMERAERARELVLEGEPLQRPKQPRASSKNFIVFLVLLVVVAAGISLATFLRPGKSSSDASANGQSAEEELAPQIQSQPAPKVYPPFTLEQQATIPGPVAEAIKDVDSPYYQANLWMRSDPQLEAYPLQRQWQRFHMVAFYLITGGDAWNRNDHWLSYNTSECNWFSSSSLGPTEAPPIICGETESMLLNLNVSANNLQGTFPRVIHFIPSIQHYDLSYNDLAGTLPVLSGQPDLLSYIVNDNAFSGVLVGR